jgi:hypothetical protein
MRTTEFSEVRMEMEEMMEKHNWELMILEKEEERLAAEEAEK